MPMVLTWIYKQRYNQMATTYKVINCGSRYEYGKVLQTFKNRAEADAYVLKLGDRSILATVLEFVK